MSRRNTSNETLAAFRTELEALVPAGAGLLLAVSGGSDSMALMCLAAIAAQERGLRIGVGFVDHGLREGVSQELELVAERAGALDLPVENVKLRPPLDEDGQPAVAGGSLQAWAREARYGSLADIARRQGATHVATAHTLDDQAETVLLRLIRGTGIDGLAAIPRERNLEDLSLVRPLLGCGRAELRRFLEGRGVSWVEDPSNRDRRFARVRAREELLPVLESMQPGAIGRIAALAADAREATKLIDELIDENKHISELRLGEGVKVDSRSFEALPEGAWPRLIRAALRRARGDLRRLERSHIEQITRTLASGNSTAELPLPGDATAHAYRGSLFVFPRPLPGLPTGAGQPVAEGSGVWRARFAALGALVEIRAAAGRQVGDLELRARRPGDRLFESDRKLKEVLSSKGVPRPYRDFVPVLAVDEWVVACPGLVPCRLEDVKVRWMLDSDCPFLDIDFPLHI